MCVDLKGGFGGVDIWLPPYIFTTGQYFLMKLSEFVRCGILGIVRGKWQKMISELKL